MFSIIAQLTRIAVREKTYPTNRLKFLETVINKLFALFGVVQNLGV